MAQIVTKPAPMVETKEPGGAPALERWPSSAGLFWEINRLFCERSFLATAFLFLILTRRI